MEGVAWISIREETGVVTFDLGEDLRKEPDGFEVTIKELLG